MSKEMKEEEMKSWLDDLLEKFTRCEFCVDQALKGLSPSQEKILFAVFMKNKKDQVTKSIRTIQKVLQYDLTLEQDMKKDDMESKKMYAKKRKE